MTFAATRLEHCLTDVSRWMSANRLKLNSEKTALVWVGSRYGHTPLGFSEAVHYIYNAGLICYPNAGSH